MAEEQFRLASSHFSDKHFREAINIYVQLVKDDTLPSTDVVRALNNISACYAALREFDTALEMAQEAAVMEPNNPQSRYRCAIACEGKMYYEEAAAHLRKAIAIKPQHPPYLEALKRVEDQIRSGHGVASAETRSNFYYDKSVKSGTAAMKAGNFTEALRQFTKALSLFPASSPAREKAVLYANRSAAQLKSLNVSESEADAREATRADPTYGRAYFRLAVALEHEKKMTEALEAGERCLELDPGHSEARALVDRVRHGVQESRKSTRERAEEQAAQLRELQEKQLAEAHTAACSSARMRSSHGYSYCTYCNDYGHVRDECSLLRAKRRRF